MTKEEYDLEIKTAQERHSQELFEIKKRFALANNKVKVGDVVGDEHSLVKVERIQITQFFSYSLPTCYYKGYELNKDGVTPKKKRGSDRIEGAVYQEYLETINGVPLEQNR